jgi:hypothetical protein
MEGATVFCPECRAEHPETCGTKVFVAAECPICLMVERPTVLLPCFHGLCPGCFEAVGGALQPRGSEKAVVWVAEPHPEEDELDERFADVRFAVPPPTHVV